MRIKHKTIPSCHKIVNTGHPSGNNRVYPHHLLAPVISPDSLIDYGHMYEFIQGSNYYDEATNKTYTNGFRSIYKYCKKHNFKFRNVVLDLFFEDAYIAKDFNPATAGLEII